MFVAHTRFLRLSLLAALLLVGACESGGEMAILDLEPQVGHTQGDQYVKIEVVVPKNLNDHAKQMLENFDRIHPDSPRGKIRFRGFRQKS